MTKNVGPKGDGSLRTIDKGMLEIVGEWVKLNEKSLRTAVPVCIEIKDKPKDFILQDGNKYFLFVHGLEMCADPNVDLAKSMKLAEEFNFDKQIKSVCWLDNGEKVDFIQENETVSIKIKPFVYGESYVVRVLEIKV